MDDNEREAREIADRLGFDFLALGGRAQDNAATEGWTILKQAKLEEIIAQEQADYRERLARRDARDMEQAAAYAPKLEAPPADPWEGVLAGVENLPNTPDGIERINGHIKARSAYLLTHVLGIDQNKVHQHHMLRLSRVMQNLGWMKPSNISIGPLVCKGYRKVLEEV